jgi:hypothetical protein
MQAARVSHPWYKVQEVHWSRHLAKAESALADLRREKTLTDRKHVHPIALKTIHGESTAIYV